MKDKIDKLTHHVIICGAGRVGQAAAEVLAHAGVPYVFVDYNHEVVDVIKEQGHLIWEGNAVEDEVLLVAGIKRARGVIAALSDDAYNVYVTLTARALNPALTVVARAEMPESVDKLHRAGADRVIPSALIAGQRMGTALVKPATLDLFDNLVHSKHFTMEIREIVAQASSPAIGANISEVFRRGETNVICVAIVKQSGQTIINPRSDETIHAGDILVLIGQHEDLSHFQHLLTQ